MGSSFYSMPRRPAAPSIAVLVMAAMATLGGCSSLGFSTDKVDYRSVQEQRPLELPPDLTPLPGNDRFTVPGVATASAAQQGAAARLQPAGGAAVVAPTSTVAQIERAGSQRWLSVNVAPEQAYAVVREFWPSIGLQLERDDPSLGIVETVWAENRAKLSQDIIRRTIGRLFDAAYSTGEQDKYRTRIERTAKNTSEIFISHRGMIEVYTSTAKDQTRWQPRPADAELEAEMLQRLMARFAAAAPGTTATAAASASAAGGSAAAAPSAGAPQLVRLVAGADGRAVRLELEEPFDRAWRRVGVGLDRGGFTVEDRDRTNGVYFVRYLDPEYDARQREQQGIFSKMLGRDPKVEAQQFRVQVGAGAAGSAGSTVTVLTKDGKPELSATSDKILRQLNDQMR